jgi:flagellar FliL protein
MMNLYKKGDDMAEEKQETNPEETKKVPKKGGKKKLIIIVAAAAVLVIAAGIAGYFMFLGGKSSVKKEAPVVKASLIALDPFVVNLAEPGRFLKMSIQLELSDPVSQPAVAEKIPQLRDTIITLMGSKSMESVSSSEGKFQLKDEIILRANQAVGKDIFKNLYFTEFVMQ